MKLRYPLIHIVLISNINDCDFRDLCVHDARDVHGLCVHGVRDVHDLCDARVFCQSLLLSSL